MLKLITFCSYKFYLLKTRENIQVNARIGSNMLPLQFYTKLRILVTKFTNALFCIKRLKRVDALKRNNMISGYYLFFDPSVFSQRFTEKRALNNFRRSSRAGNCSRCTNETHALMPSSALPVLSNAMELIP